MAASDDGASADPTGSAPPQTFLERWAARARRARERTRDVMDVLAELRAPFVVSLIGCVAFAVPGQTREIYRLLAEDFDFARGFTAENLRFALFFLLLWVTCYALWYVGRALTLFDLKTTDVIDKPGLIGKTARWAPRVIGAAPAFAAAAGLAAAEMTRVGDVRTDGLYGAAAIAFLIGALRLWLSYARVKTDRQLLTRVHDAWFSLRARLGFGALLLAMVGFLMTNPIEVTQTLGTLSIFCLFMIALVYGAAQLTYLNDRYGIPALALLVGMGLTWGALDWNDNHYIRTLEPAPLEAAPDVVELTVARDSIDAAFDAWLDARPSREAFQAAGKRYPVYIVAAQGGGLYAAHQSALFMARLQDACPRFSEHVFAISAVSGGAIGSTIFTALAEERAEAAPRPSATDPLDCAAAAPENQFEPRMRDVLGRDFLSPTLSALLFGDFTARFSPRPLPALDRARALEAAFEIAWTDAATRSGDPLDGPGLERGLLDYWRPTGDAPLLLLNTTEADTGLPLVLSPIRDLGPNLRSYADVAARDAALRVPDMRLSTAMVLSARFPFITPPGSLDVLYEFPDGRTEVRKARVVDGSYFDNSGISTATDVLRTLRTRLRERQRAAAAAARRGETVERAQPLEIDLRLILFDFASVDTAPPEYGFAEALTPLKAIFNARVSRAEQAQDRARQALFSDCRYLLVPGDPDFRLQKQDLCLPSDLADSRVWSVSLDGDAYNFELGWILSRATLDQISRQLGRPQDCVIGQPSPAAPLADGVGTLGEAASDRERPDSIAIHNSCIGRFILRQISGDGRAARSAQAAR